MMSMLIACHSDAEDVGKESSPPLPARGERPEIGKPSHSGAPVSMSVDVTHRTLAVVLFLYVILNV